jgi:hypothetical protein
MLWRIAADAPEASKAISLQFWQHKMLFLRVRPDPVMRHFLFLNKVDFLNSRILEVFMHCSPFKLYNLCK